jgi:hypothetical protein
MSAKGAYVASMLNRTELHGAHDFDFLFGRWSVAHRKLKQRLAGSDEWIAFDGTCDVRPLLGGAGNCDENWLGDPSGAYAALTLRLFDPAEGRWSIRWVDGRFMRLEPPVHGGFDGDAGIFLGEDSWEGRPIQVRFIWRRLGTDRAQWEQAFSDDRGSTWETNWTMDFTRAE